MEAPNILDLPDLQKDSSNGLVIMGREEMEGRRQAEKIATICKSVPAITRFSYPKLTQVKEGEAIVDIPL